MLGRKKIALHMLAIFIYSVLLSAA